MSAPARRAGTWLRRAGAPVAGAAALVLLLACGGGGGSSSSGKGYPQPSPKGRVLGLSSAATIGAQGGTLVSPDGLLTIAIPAGAVASPVAFTVDEITNTAPGALDPAKAYRLGPEGTTFSAPVSLTFVAAAPGAPLDGIAVAYQERQGFWLRYRDRDVARDLAAGTVTVASLHFSDWSLVGSSTRDLDGVVTVDSTLGKTYTATGNLALNYAAEDAGGAYFLQWGTLALDSTTVTAPDVACTAADPAFELDATIAEVLGSRAFRFGITARWPLSCSYAGGAAYDELLSLQFDTLGIYHPTCKRTLAAGSVISQDRLQGQYTLDCSTAGAVQLTWDLTTAAMRVPVAMDDSVTVSEGSFVVVNVLANDTVADGVAGLTILAGPANGTAVLNPDRTVTYTPTPGYFGPDTFTYQVTDSDGQTGSATVSVTVTAVDSGSPVAVDDAVTTLEDTATTVNVLANDTVQDPPATVAIATAPGKGTATVNADGTITYTPSANAFGADAFSYQVSDYDGQVATATASVTVTAVDDGPPVAVDEAVTLAEGGVVVIGVLANDTVVDGVSALVVTAGPAGGTAVVNADHTITYTPAPAFNGADAFTYQVTDGDGQTASATVSITVTAVDSGAPVAVADSASTPEGSAVVVPVLANDTVLDRPATVTVIAAPAHGSAVANVDGTVTYTPAAGWNGADAFTYQVADADGQASSASVSVTVAPVDSGAPAAVADAATTLEGTATTVAVLANDTVQDPPATVTVLSSPAHGTAVANADGTVTYTPTPGWNGSDAFTYQVGDLDGQTASATVTITVTAVDSGAPVAVADAASTAEGTAAVVAVLANDTVQDLPATVTVLSAPAHGTAVANADGTVTYTPAPTWNGSDAFTYQVADLDGQTASATVNVTVAPVDSGAPVAVADAITTGEGVATLVAVLANDTIADLPATVTVLTPPTYGTAIANADGTITYTPASGWNGADAFTYQVADLDGQTATANVTVAVTPVDSGAPVALADTASTAEGSPAIVPVLANDVVLDLPPSVTIASAPVHGTAVANADGTVTYTPAAGWNGTDVFTYQVADLDGQAAQADVTVTVTPADSGAPAAVADVATTAEDTPAAVTVLANDTVADPPATVSLLGAPAHGAATVQADGSILYTPAANWFGDDAFTYQVFDLDGQVASAAVSVTVSPVDDGPPVPVDDAAPVPVDTPTIIAVLANDTVVDGVASVIPGAPANGTAVANADGTITYTPNAAYAGADAFTYQVTDTDGQSATGTVSITVTSP
ncbi:outer membrane adhesin like protein [Anaeromyxobacter dehalogenans 2CP-1]|uniref:Outer membrane adhesin like protein n=1 Tax=Anaeromyxobacter dehalogenans (strain ATCC BAA-258 / DSM 21875 / 2CP-1) TaxID=455488 RepID=B8JGV3_ANAD2|nr:Ig-like domain-containing protein [Anaeromyxobacter dehalogenans]ACL66590.1 outer membrane adhesin like protein [Anaeromyxobacter dehalogenans 2CP-1]